MSYIVAVLLCMFYLHVLHVGRHVCVSVVVHKVRGFKPRDVLSGKLGFFTFFFGGGDGRRDRVVFGTASVLGCCNIQTHAVHFGRMRYARWEVIHPLRSSVEMFSGLFIFFDSQRGVLGLVFPEFLQAR